MMITLTAEVLDSNGEAVQDSFQIRNPELETWLSEHGEHLNGIEFEED